MATASHGSNRAGLGLCWCCFPTRPPKPHTGPHRCEFVFSLQNELTPPPLGGGAGYRLSWVCWSFPAEKPGAFPQEKTDTSYPRASLGSCLWQLLVTAGPTGRVCCFGGVVSLPRPLTSQKSPHRGEFGFSRQNELTPPPKGGGVGLFSNSGCLGLLDSSTAGSHRFNGAGNPFRWCRSPTWPPKANTGPHRAEFGFCLLAGASQEDHPPFRQSRIRTQAEEKIPLPHFSEMEPVKSVIPCKRLYL